ncbi:MAG: recombinase family protein [Bacteroidetes bacterium]|nr:recombinase family protein [Bacteroidota bacterium]
MKKVYGYIRVSTAKQGEGVSLIVQKDAIERYASQYNLTIVKWFEEKETAAKQGRPLFTAMMKLLRQGRASGVIIHKIDRSARNLKDWADLGNLIDQGVEVHFAHESLDLQARGGRLSADIQAVIAADYIRNLRQEAIKGLYGRLKQGIYPFYAPIGYLNSGKGKLKAIDPVQGPLVKKAFELYATKRYTLDTLGSHLYELGLRSTTNTKLSRNGLSVVLSNTFYMGIITVKGQRYDGKHEALISPDLYNKVQSVLIGKTNQKVLKYAFQFKKYISCKTCSYSLTAEIQKGITYYRCHTKGCTTKGVRESMIEATLFRAFSTVRLNPEEYSQIETILSNIEKDWASKLPGLIDGLKLRSALVEKKIDRITECYIEEGLSKEEYEERKLKLLEERKANEAAERELLENQANDLKRVEKFFELSKSLTESYKTGNAEKRRELLEAVTSNLLVEGKNIMIPMRSPFIELAFRTNFTISALDRDTLRKEYSSINYTESTLLSASNNRLSIDALKKLVYLILEIFTEERQIDPPE